MNKLFETAAILAAIGMLAGIAATSMAGNWIAAGIIAALFLASGILVSAVRPEKK